MEKHSGQVVRTVEVIGKKVIDRNKNNIGSVEELVLDKINGQVRYAVLSFGGFLGMGDKLYAMPWKSLNYCPEDDSFEVSLDKAMLEKAHGFDKDSWPDFADSSYTSTIDDFYAL